MKYRDDILQRLHDRIEVALRTAAMYQRQQEQERHGQSGLVAGLQRSKVQAAVKDVRMMATRIQHVDRVTGLQPAEYDQYKDLVMRVGIVQHLA